MSEGLFCKSLNCHFLGLLVQKKRHPPIPSLWVSDSISRISNEIVFLNLRILYGIKLNLIKFVTFLGKIGAFNATYSVCFIPFHSIPFRKTPIAVYKANVNRSSKCTIIQVLKLMLVMKFIL